MRITFFCCLLACVCLCYNAAHTLWVFDIKEDSTAIHAITVLHFKLHPYIFGSIYTVIPLHFFPHFIHICLSVSLHLYLLPCGHVCLYYAILNSHFCVIIPENAFVSLYWCCCKIHAAYNRRIKREIRNVTKVEQ